MSPPRGLSADEKAAWAHLAKSVAPLAGREVPKALTTAPSSEVVRASSSRPMGGGKPSPSSRPRPPAHKPARIEPPSRQSGLDSHWDRRIKSGRLVPDLTLDLHGHTLDAAYDRIQSGLDQARAMDARVVLVIAGRERPVDPADRAERRGAIRAKLLDWLAAGRHAGAISAVRRAHKAHGGEGALYLILKRPR